jgi:hypothetical protein
MSDNDLERDLRSQRGPREDGYQPSALPMSLEEQPAAAARPARLARTALLVGVGAAGALAVAVVASILSASGPGPEVGAGSASPSAEATARPLAACGIQDVARVAEAWGGAAGSRGTVVTVSLAQGRYACALPATVYGQIVDSSGAQLVTGRTPATTGSVSLDPGAAFTIGVAWSNWCGSEPAAPLSLSLAFGGGPSLMVGEHGSIPASAVPPCSGDGSTSLSLTDLEAAP